MSHCETAFQAKSKQSQFLDCFDSHFGFLTMTVIFFFFFRCIPLYAEPEVLSAQDRLLLKQIQKDSLNYFLTSLDGSLR